VIGKDERHGNQGDMDAQPGNPIGLVDEHQSDCQGNIEDPLKEQGDAGRDTEKEGDSQDDEGGAEDRIEGLQKHGGKKRLEGELVLKRLRNGMILRNSVNLLDHVNHRTARILHPGDGIHQRVLDLHGFGVFVDTGDKRANAQPSPEEKKGQGLATQQGVGFRCAHGLFSLIDDSG